MSRNKGVFFLLILLLSIGSLAILKQLKKSTFAQAQTAPEPFLFESTTVFLKFSDIVISINGQQIPFQPSPGSYNYANVKINPRGIPFNNPLYREIELTWKTNSSDMYVLFFAHRYAQSDKWRVYQIHATDGNGLTLNSKRYFEGFETIPYSAKYEKTITLTQQGESAQPMTLTFTNLELDVFMDQPEKAIGTCPMLPQSNFPERLTIEQMRLAIPEKIDTLQSEYSLGESNNTLGTLDDGYATLYSFVALNRQSFQTLTTEVPSRSFVSSFLYNKDGELISEGGTRLNHTASYTGLYYLLVKTFECRSGQIVLELNDLQLRGTNINPVKITAQADSGKTYPIVFSKIILPRQDFQLLIDVGQIESFNESVPQLNWNVRKEGSSTLQVYSALPKFIMHTPKASTEVPLTVHQLSSSTFLITPRDKYYFSSGDTYTFNLDFISPDYLGDSIVTIQPQAHTTGDSTVTIRPQDHASSHLCRSDINQDRLVDISDYSILVRNFFAPITETACQ